MISDFNGPDFEMSGEVLNLMARRDLLFRVIWKTPAAAQPFTGLKLCFTRMRPPRTRTAPQNHRLRGTGRLADHWARVGLAGQAGPTRFPQPNSTSACWAKGRLAVARQALTDPYQVAAETQLLLSHRYDLVKIYNAPSSGGTRLTAPAEGRKALLQCVSYADGGRGGGGLRTIWIREQFAKARLWGIGNDPVSIAAEPSEEYTGVEYHLPTTAPRSYLALEFEA